MCVRCVWSLSCVFLIVWVFSRLRPRGVIVLRCVVCGVFAARMCVGRESWEGGTGRKREK